MEILLFGITREVVGKPTLHIPAEAEITTVRQLKVWLGQQYPTMQGLHSLAVAVDNEYAQEEQTIHPHQEIALIPPVSGG